MSFPPIPLDVGLLIMEWTARCSKKAACTLSLVSKDIQSLTDKILFEHITINGVKRQKLPSFWYIPERIHLSLMRVFCDSPSPRIERARNYITSFTYNVPTGPKYRDLFVTIMKTCPKLRSFATTGLLPPECEKLSLPQLKQLCFTAGQTFEPYEGDFFNPLFDQITHLDLGTFDRPILEQMEGFSFHDMPNLTHITFRIPHILSTSDASHLSHLLPKSIQVALIFLMSEPESNTVEKLEEDPRIVLCFTTPSIRNDIEWSMDMTLDNQYDPIALQKSNDWNWIIGESIWEEAARIAEEHKKELQRTCRVSCVGSSSV